MRNVQPKHMTDTLQKRFETFRDGIILWGDLRRTQNHQTLTSEKMEFLIIFDLVTPSGFINILIFEKKNIPGVGLEPTRTARPLELKSNALTTRPSWSRSIRLAC